MSGRELLVSERTLSYEMDEGPREYIVTTGVPRGSVLCQLLWNVTYKRGCDRGSADDLVVVVTAKHSVSRGCGGLQDGGGKGLAGKGWIDPAG